MSEEDTSEVEEWRDGSQCGVYARGASDSELA